MKVIIIEGILPTLMPEGPDIERKILGTDAEVNRFGIIHAEEYKTVLSDVDAVIVRPGTLFTKEILSVMKKIRVIVSLGVGFDHICIDATKERGIPVCNVPNYGTEEVADSTVAMILAHQRKIFLFKHKHHFNSESVVWDWRVNIPITRTNHIQVGIIGLGRIGTAVALRLKAFRFKIAFYDPYLPRGVEKSIGLNRFHKLKPLLESSDIVTLHVPLTEETSGLVDNTFFDHLRPNVILINTSRGGIFKDVDTIYRHLKERPGLRIGTDVWPEEPPERHPLIDAWKGSEQWLGDRLILCPHSSFYSVEAVIEKRAFAAQIVRDILNGGNPYNIVNGVGL